METIISKINEELSKFEAEVIENPKVRLVGTKLEEVNQLITTLYYANLVVEQTTTPA